MPRRRLPDTAPTTLRTLKAARDEYKNTADPADRAISAEQFAQLTDEGEPESLLTHFDRKCREVDIALAKQGPLTGELAAQKARTAILVSHFHQVFDFAVARGEFSAGARRYYGRDISAKELPPLETYDDVATAAKAIVKGEAMRAEAEGAAFVPMAMPPAAAVQTALEAFAAARLAAQAALERTDAAREAAAALFPDALTLAVDVCETVEFFYRKDRSASSRRAKCRRWGVAYEFARGETPDPQTPGAEGANHPAGGNPPAGDAPA
jgi:hypothetical protein